MQAAADELFDMVVQKKIKVAIGQRFPLESAADAHIALAGRATTGATVLTL